MFRLVADLTEINLDQVKLPKVPGLGMLLKLPQKQRLGMIVNVLNMQKGQFLPKWQEALRQKWGQVELLDYKVEQPVDASCLVRIRMDVGESDYDKAIDTIIPQIYQPQKAKIVLGEDYTGATDVQTVVAYMHSAEDDKKKEFYLVKTLSVEKENIARMFEAGAASQNAVIKVKQLRFFLKKS